jgi:PucR C-terminal helix-turn-helix domain
MAKRASSTGTAPDAISTVVASIEARIDSIAETMVKRYRERIESYKDAPPDVIADAHEWARASITIAAGIITGALDVQDFVEPLTDVGRRRAAQGFPLHDVLQANLIGTEVLWEAVWAVAPDDEADKSRIASVVMGSTMTLLQNAVSAVSTGYEEVAHGKVADEEYDMQALMETLAGVREPDKKHEERARVRGVDLDAIRWCLVSRTSHEDAGFAVRNMRRKHKGAAVGRIGRTVIAYLPGNEMPEPLVTPAGVTRATDTVRAFKRARATLEVAIHLNRECVLYEDVVPLAMVLGGPAEEREAFVKAQLGPLLEDQLGDELVKTLGAYYASGQSVAAAARELFVHRHTLEYRLQRIEDLLGKELKAGEDRLLLELALAIRKDDQK